MPWKILRIADGWIGQTDRATNLAATGLRIQNWSFKTANKTGALLAKFWTLAAKR